MPPYNRRTHEEYVKLINEKFPDKYTILGQYVNAQTKILVLCNSCNNTWNPIANNLLRGKGCPVCFGNAKYTTETFKEKVKEMYGNEYEVLGNYIDSQTKIKMKHIKCNYTYEVKPNNFINGRQCPNCKNERISESNRMSQEEFDQRIIEITNGEYEVIGEYLGRYKKVKIKHKICNYEYLVIPDNFLRGTRCPLCKVSVGEEKIKEFLDFHSIPYEVEYSFDDLRHNGLLRFDFAVFNDKDKTELNSLIEFDGEFHFDVIISEDHLKLQQYRDNLKDEYCLKKGINLIRISYWNYDVIHEILTKELLERPRNEEEFKLWQQLSVEVL